MKERLSWFERILEYSGWVSIMFSPLLIGSTAGVIVYVALPSQTGSILALMLALAGLIIGSIWATRVYRKQGTIHFLSRMMATPELDHLPNEEAEKEDVSTGKSSEKSPQLPNRR